MPHLRSSTRTTGSDTGLASLFDFVEARIRAAVGAAAAAGDAPAERFTRQTQTILADMRRDLREDPRRADEVSRFLHRMAAAYVDHPDYRSHWTLFTAP